MYICKIIVGRIDNKIIKILFSYDFCDYFQKYSPMSTLDELANAVNKSCWEIFDPGNEIRHRDGVVR